MRETSGSPVAKSDGIRQIQLCGQKGTHASGAPEIKEIAVGADGSMKMAATVVAAIATTPSGAASGDLGQTYPNPTVVNGSHLGAATVPNSALQSSVALKTDNLGVFAASTSAAIGVGTVELGAASDTTISRVSAGKIAVEGVNVVTTSSTDTLTNKIIDASQLTGALPAISGAALTNLPSPSVGLPGTVKAGIATLDSSGTVTIHGGVEFPEPISPSTGAYATCSNINGTGLLNVTGNPETGAGGGIAFTSAAGFADSGATIVWHIVYI